MAKKDKKGNSVINALKCLNMFSETEIEAFELALKRPDLRNKFLKDYQIQIKKGQLIKRIKLNKVVFETDKIIKCTDVNILSELEQQVSLEIKKDNLFRTINEKKIPIPKHTLEQIALCTNVNDLNHILDNFPNNLKIELGKFKFRRSEPDFVSVIPIYTPMGNKR